MFALDAGVGGVAVILWFAGAAFDGRGVIEIIEGNAIGRIGAAAGQVEVMVLDDPRFEGGFLPVGVDSGDVVRRGGVVGGPDADAIP